MVVKNFEETTGKFNFLLEAKHKVFRFKTKPIPQMPVQDIKSGLKMLVAQLSVEFATSWS